MDISIPLANLQAFSSIAFSLDEASLSVPVEKGLIFFSNDPASLLVIPETPKSQDYWIGLQDCLT